MSCHHFFHPRRPALCLANMDDGASEGSRQGSMVSKLLPQSVAYCCPPSRHFFFLLPFQVFPHRISYVLFLIAIFLLLLLLLLLMLFRWPPPHPSRLARLGSARLGSIMCRFVSTHPASTYYLPPMAASPNLWNSSFHSTDSRMGLLTPCAVDPIDLSDGEGFWHRRR